MYGAGVGLCAVLRVRHAEETNNAPLVARQGQDGLSVRRFDLQKFMGRRGFIRRWRVKFGNAAFHILAR